MIDLKLLEKTAKERKKSFQKVLQRSNNQHVIRSLPILHDKAFEHINCLDCANCCKNYSPRFKMPDIKRIAKYLGLKEGKLIDQYLKIDDDGDYVLTTHPCPFLEEENKCSIYDVRPRDCQRYPYTDEDVFVKQIGLSLKNSEVCPAAFNVIEQMEQNLG